MQLFNIIKSAWIRGEIVKMYISILTSCKDGYLEIIWNFIHENIWHQIFFLSNSFLCALCILEVRKTVFFFAVLKFWFKGILKIRVSRVKFKSDRGGVTLMYDTRVTIQYVAMHFCQPSYFATCKFISILFHIKINITKLENIHFNPVFKFWIINHENWTSYWIIRQKTCSWLNST